MMIEPQTPTTSDTTIYKMYVFVRTDIPFVHQAVQAGHAVAEYLIQHGKPTIWNNGIMVYLGVKDELELVNIERGLKTTGARFSSFYEPDWGVLPQLTAISIIEKEAAFPTYRTVRMDTGWKKFTRKVKSWIRM